MPLYVHASLDWLHEFADTQVNGIAAFGLPGAGTFTYATAPIGRDAARIGVGAGLEITPAVSLFADYRATLAANSTAQYLTGGLRVRW
jgi:outer membrane autotransporter protein